MQVEKKKGGRSPPFVLDFKGIGPTSLELKASGGFDDLQVEIRDEFP